MMHEWWEGWGPGGWSAMWFGPLIWLLLLALLIIGIASLWRRSSNSGETISARPTPRQILNERFARGEIDKDEYQERLSALRD
jgi:putative membrane protein